MAKQKRSKLPDQETEIDSESYQELLGDISEIAQKGKIEQDLRPILYEAMRNLEETLKNKSYGQCEIKILVNLPSIGWVRYWNKRE